MLNKGNQAVNTWSASTKTCPPKAGNTTIVVVVFYKNLADLL